MGRRDCDTLFPLRVVQCVGNTDMCTLECWLKKSVVTYYTFALSSIVAQTGGLV